MNLKQCYALLEIQPDASEEEIRRAYRDLVAVWHPDRHQQNPRLREKATARLKELNVAFETLVAHRRTRAVERAPTGTLHDTPSPGRPAASAKTAQPKRPLSVWLLLLAGICVAALVVQSRWTDLVDGVPRLLPEAAFDRFSKNSMPPAADENGGTAGQLDSAPIDAKQVAALQRSLNLMGYDCGPVDGNMGAKTLRAALLFADDFQVPPDGRFVDRLLAETNRQAAVARVHTQWPVVARSSELKAWVETQTLTAPDTCRKVLAVGTADQLINLVNAYRFDRERPQPEVLPRSGILQKHYYRGLAPLKINTRNEGRHYFVRLLALPERRDAVEIFIRSGDKVDLRVPLGEYELKYAVGRQWYGRQWLFGNESVYGRIENPVHFSLTGNEISGNTIHLYLSPVPEKAKHRDYAFDF